MTDVTYSRRCAHIAQLLPAPVGWTIRRADGHFLYPVAALALMSDHTIRAVSVNDNLDGFEATADAEDATLFAPHESYRYAVTRELDPRKGELEPPDDEHDWEHVSSTSHNYGEEGLGSAIFITWRTLKNAR